MQAEAGLGGREAALVHPPAVFREAVALGLYRNGIKCIPAHVKVVKAFSQVETVNEMVAGQAGPAGRMVTGPDFNV